MSEVPYEPGDLTREALEMAEEEIAFAKDTGSDEVVVSRLTNYKRQRDLARAVLDQQKTIERLKSELRIEKASQATRGNFS